jgi:hypothetical protein
MMVTETVFTQVGEESVYEMTPLHDHNFLVLYLYRTCFIVHDYNVTCHLQVINWEVDIILCLDNYAIILFKTVLYI